MEGECTQCSSTASVPINASTVVAFICSRGWSSKVAAQIMSSLRALPLCAPFPASTRTFTPSWAVSLLSHMGLTPLSILKRLKWSRCKADRQAITDSALTACGAAAADDIPAIAHQLMAVSSPDPAVSAVALLARTLSDTPCRVGWELKAQRPVRLRHVQCCCFTAGYCWELQELLTSVSQ